MAATPLDPLRRALRQHLESLAAAGVSHLPRPAAVGASAVASATGADSATAPTRHAAGDGGRTPDRGAAANLAAPTNSPAAPSPPAGLFEDLATATNAASAAAEDRSEAPTLEVLQQEVAGCTRCGELARTRTQTVFGVGNPRARLCFLGEAPGADEDRQGEPFVGRAGQLLNKILEACRLRREEVYILNVIKCRPPGNRNPAPDEAANCRRYLDRQLELIEPEFICCLGSVAAQNLLATTETIGRLRGRIHQFDGIQVVCTYHPAYLLRNPAAKKQTWDDMKLLMRTMGAPID